MPVYRVIRKSDGEEVIRYCAGGVLEQINDTLYPLTEYDHPEYIEGAAIEGTASRILTKLEYLRRFTQTERVTIREVAKTNPVLEDYLALLELAEEINTGDPDTIAAVNMLEQSGLLAAGRAQEILNG